MPRVHALRAEDLAQAFDHSFVEARAQVDDRTTDFLAIHIAGIPHALRLGEIAGLHPAPPLTVLPGPLAELSGIVGLRGTLLPVYDLAGLLGHLATGTCRWLAVAAAAPVAFAFEAFDGHFRVPAASVVSSPGATAESLREVVTAGDSRRAVIRLDFLVTSIRRRIPSATP